MKCLSDSAKGGATGGVAAGIIATGILASWHPGILTASIREFTPTAFEPHPEKPESPQASAPESPTFSAVTPLGAFTTHSHAILQRLACPLSHRKAPTRRLYTQVVHYIKTYLKRRGELPSRSGVSDAPYFRVLGGSGKKSRL